MSEFAGPPHLAALIRTRRRRSPRRAAASPPPARPPARLRKTTSPRPSLKPRTLKRGSIIHTRVQLKGILMDLCNIHCDNPQAAIRR